jgi:hypothetical protein
MAAVAVMDAMSRKEPKSHN